MFILLITADCDSTVNGFQSTKYNPKYFLKVVSIRRLWNSK